MIDSDKIFRRANIQDIRSLFLTGVDRYKEKIDPRDYEERQHEGEKPLLEHIEYLYPDGPVRDAFFEIINNAILVNEEIYTEIGIRVGAQLMIELLQKTEAPK